MLKKNEYNLINRDLLQKYIELTKRYIVIQRQSKDKYNSSQKYKTELCKKFQSIGFCPYANKCRFAHGKEELITKIQNANYKKKNVEASMKKDIVHMELDAIFSTMKENLKI